MFNYDVTELFPRRNYRHFFWLREIELRQRLIPTRHVLEKARKYVREHNICNASAMHIRRSDMWIVLKSYQRTSYDRWVANRPPHEPVYLMTDNPKTQQTLSAQIWGPQTIGVPEYDGFRRVKRRWNAWKRH